MEWTKPFVITNQSGMIVLSGVIEVPHGANDYYVDPTRHPETTIDALKVFEQRGTIQVKNVSRKVDTKSVITDVKKVKTVANESGDTNDHFVFNPNIEPVDYSAKAIETHSINTNGLINEESIDTSGKAITVASEKEDRMSKEDAVSLLGQQWKKFESEISKINDLRKLNFLQVTAIELGVSDKKKEIIQNRINSL